MLHGSIRFLEILINIWSRLKLNGANTPVCVYMNGFNQPQTSKKKSPIGVLFLIFFLRTFAHKFVIVDQIKDMKQYFDCESTFFSMMIAV